MVNALRVTNAGRAASAGIARQRGRGMLVVSEIALAMIVATGAGLMVKSFLNARNRRSWLPPGPTASSRFVLACSTIATKHRETSFDSRAR